MFININNLYPTKFDTCTLLDKYSARGVPPIHSHKRVDVKQMDGNKQIFTGGKDMQMNGLIDKCKEAT